MPVENRVPHFYLSTVRALSLVQKTAKLNAFPKADGNRARCSNPISTNLSRGKDKYVLLCGASRGFIHRKTFFIYLALNDPFIPLYRRRSR